MKLPGNSEIAYRYFDQADDSQRLVDGYVWVSTVDHIRKANGLRGDAREMTWAYRPDGLDSQNDDEAIKATLASLDIEVAPGGRVQISGVNFVIERRDPNTFMLCASEFPPTRRLLRTFGKNCVKIDCMPSFWNAITA